MADIVKIIGIAFITAITAVILRGTKPELSFAVTLVGIIIILMFVVEMLKDTMSVFVSLSQITGIENGLLKMLLKIVGVGYLTEFGAGILTDFGSNSIADKVTLAGKITIVLLSMPVIESLLQLLSGFLQLV
jgi:stage III sporulation protein AD